MTGEYKVDHEANDRSLTLFSSLGSAYLFSYDGRTKNSHGQAQRVFIHKYRQRDFSVVSSCITVNEWWKRKRGRERVGSNLRIHNTQEINPCDPVRRRDLARDTLERG